MLNWFWCYKEFTEIREHHYAVFVWMLSLTYGCRCMNGAFGHVVGPTQVRNIESCWNRTLSLLHWCEQAYRIILCSICLLQDSSKLQPFQGTWLLFWTWQDAFLITVGNHVPLTVLIIYCKILYCSLMLFNFFGVSPSSFLNTLNSNPSLFSFQCLNLHWICFDIFLIYKVSLPQFFYIFFYAFDLLIFGDINLLLGALVTHKDPNLSKETSLLVYQGV